MITKEEIQKIWDGIWKVMGTNPHVTPEFLNKHCADVAAKIRERKKKKL